MRIQDKIEAHKKENGIKSFGISFDDLIKKFTIKEMRYLNDIGLISNEYYTKAKMVIN